jgi:hypothetical protein
MTFNELNEKVNTISDSCAYVMNSRQPDEYTIAQFEMVSVRVSHPDGRVTCYTIHKHRLIDLGIPTNAGYYGYISNETYIPDGWYNGQKHRAKLYTDKDKFEKALKRIAKMGGVFTK